MEAPTSGFVAKVTCHANLVEDHALNPPQLVPFQTPITVPVPLSLKSEVGTTV